MNADKALTIVSGIVTIGLVTVVVSHPETKKIIAATGAAFANAMRAAMGK